MPNKPNAAASTALDASLKRFLDALLDSTHEDLIAMLAVDAVMEFPYAFASSPQRLEGKAEIVKFLTRFESFLVLRDIELVRAHHTTDANIAILEYEGFGESVKAGRPYRQKYITVLTFRDGQILYWKDYWNPIPVLAATGDLSASIGTITSPPSSDRCVQDQSLRPSLESQVAD